MATRKASILNCLQNTKKLYSFTLLAAAFTWVTNEQPIDKNREVRLTGSQYEWEGFVEVFYQGIWGAVCSEWWDETDGRVVCRQLGYEFLSVRASGASFVKAPRRFIMYNVHCTGYEFYLAQCNAYLSVYDDICYLQVQAIVICKPPPGSLTNTVRLSGEGASWRGTVQVYFASYWGTVCDDSWDLNDAQVVCRQLGFEGVLEVYMYNGGKFPSSAGVHALYDVECTGDELELQDCPASWGERFWECSKEEAAGVACLDTSDRSDCDQTSTQHQPICIPGDPNITLVGGTFPNQGRVEIFLNGQWGTVCDTDWGIDGASVVCRQLGYESAVEAVRGGTFGDGEGEVYLDEVKCHGDETSTYFCYHNGFRSRSFDCLYAGSNNRAGVVCLSDEYPNYVFLPANTELSSLAKASISITLPSLILLCVYWFYRSFVRKKNDESNQQLTVAATNNAVTAPGNIPYASVPTSSPPAQPSGEYLPGAYQSQPATAPSARDLPPDYDSVVREPGRYTYPSEPSSDGSDTDALPPPYSELAVSFNQETNTVNVNTSNSTNT